MMLGCRVIFLCFFVRICLVCPDVLKTTPSSKIDAVMLTTGKDIRAFLKSIASAMKHLVDVDKFYVITPNIDELKKNLGKHDERIILMDEKKFPFNGSHVDEVMIGAVKDRGIYPIDGKSQFERTIWGRIGWFLQQLIKFYAGRVFGLKDYVLLDSDIIWFNDVKFIAQLADTNNASAKYKGNKYFYATSNQYHPAYIATLPRISGVPLHDHKPVFRSGIVHHMVIVQSVLDDLIDRSEKLHGLPFWQVLLNVR